MQRVPWSVRMAASRRGSVEGWRMARGATGSRGWKYGCDLPDAALVIFSTHPRQVPRLLEHRRRRAGRQRRPPRRARPLPRDAVGRDGHHPRQPARGAAALASARGAARGEAERGSLREPAMEVAMGGGGTGETRWAPYPNDASVMWATCAARATSPSGRISLVRTRSNVSQSRVDLRQPEAVSD